MGRTTSRTSATTTTDPRPTEPRAPTSSDSQARASADGPATGTYRTSCLPSPTPSWASSVSTDQACSHLAMASDDSKHHTAGAPFIYSLIYGRGRPDNTKSVLEDIKSSPSKKTITVLLYYISLYISDLSFAR